MTDAPKLLSREELDSLLESLRDHAAEGALGGSLFNEQKAVRAIRAHIAALEAERDAARIRLAAMVEVFGGYCTPEVDDAIGLMQELGLDVWSMQRSMEISSAAYRRGLEDAAKIAETVKLEAYASPAFIRQKNDNRRNIAAAIRALEPRQEQRDD